MSEVITVHTQLMPNGVKFTFEPAWDETGYRKDLEFRLERFKAYMIMGCTADIIRKPGYMEFVDEPPESTWIARGLPIMVDKKQIAEVEASNAEAAKEHRFEDHIDVVVHDGASWILSPYASCRRIAVNVRARLTAAAHLQCQYRVSRGAASWKGQMPVKVEG